jgi:hypothetical protein
MSLYFVCARAVRAWRRHKLTYRGWLAPEKLTEDGAVLGAVDHFENSVGRVAVALRAVHFRQRARRDGHGGGGVLALGDGLRPRRGLEVRGVWKRLKRKHPAKGFF